MSKSLVTWTIFFLALLYAGTQFLMPGNGFWVVDNENKRLQVEAGGFIEWPGDQWDGAGPFHPLPPPFVTPFQGKWVSQYSPLFASISRPFFSMLGNRGLFVLPWFGSLLIFLSMAWIGRILSLSSRWTAALLLATALTTPIWFYAQTFWEHTLSLGLFMMGFAAICSFITSGSTRTLWLGQVGLIAASLLREEALLLWAAINASLFLRKQVPRLLHVLAAGIPAVLLWGLNLLFLKTSTGAWLGHHASSNAAGPADWLASRWESIYNLWLALHSLRAVSIVIGLPLLALFILSPAAKSARLIAAGTLGLASAMLVLIQKGAGDPVLTLLATNGFFTAAPLCVLGLFALPDTAGPQRDIHQLAWLTALGFGLTYTLLAPAISTQGIHWGARFLLPVYLLLTLRAILLLDALTQKTDVSRIAQPMALVLAAAAILLQLHSLDLLKNRKTYSAALQAGLAEQQEAVWITDRWWVGHAVWSHFSSHPVYLIRTPSAWEDLRRELIARGTDEALWITRPSAATPPDAASIHSPNMDYYSLCWYPITLGN